MTTLAGGNPYRLPGRNSSSPTTEEGYDGPPRSMGDGGSGPADRRVVVGYGFWLFVLSDLIMFSALFAAYTVLSGATAGGPTGKEVLELGGAKIETVLLLLSSFASGLAAVAVGKGSVPRALGWMGVTGLLGLGFLIMEIREFAGLIAQGAGPDRSAYLSSFFGLVGCHGLHVAAGLAWLVLLMAHVAKRGLRKEILRRLLCFSIFWHALDIVWVAILTNVYLIGTR